MEGCVTKTKIKNFKLKLKTNDFCFVLFNLKWNVVKHEASCNPEKQNNYFINEKYLFQHLNKYKKKL